MRWWKVSAKAAGFRGEQATDRAHTGFHREGPLVEVARVGGVVDERFGDAADALVGGDRNVEDRVGNGLQQPQQQRNAEFHEMLAGCAANAYLLDSVRRVNRVRRLVEYRHQADRQRLVHQAREHLELLDLLESGEHERAAEYLRAHLDEVRERKTRQPSR